MCVPFPDCISEINKTLTDNGKEIAGRKSRQNRKWWCKNFKIRVSLKYSSTFWRTLEMP